MPRKPKSSRNVIHADSQLRKATDYLEYDLHTFVASLEIYFQARNTQGAKEIGNAALDSFLLRARLMLDFFLRDDAEDDDVIALDYFHDINPKPYTPRITKGVTHEKRKINKRLMHLTTEPMPRLRSNQHYSLKYLVPQIKRSFLSWLAVVPDSRIQQPAAESHKVFLKHLERLDRLIK